MNGLFRRPVRQYTTMCRGQPTSVGSANGLLFAVPADTDELLGVKAGAADEGAVHVGRCHDPGDVVHLDRSPVQDPYLVSQVAGKQLGEPRPDGGTDLLGVFRGGSLTCPDRPYWLVGDHDAAGVRRPNAGEGAIELAQGVLDLTALTAYIEPLTDAHDRRELVGLGRPDLGVHECVVLMVILPPLRVADDDIPAAQLGKHASGYLARIWAALVLRHVLRAVLDQ